MKFALVFLFILIASQINATVFSWDYPHRQYWINVKLQISESSSAIHSHIYVNNKYIGVFKSPSKKTLDDIEKLSKKEIKKFKDELNVKYKEMLDPKRKDSLMFKFVEEVKKEEKYGKKQFTMLKNPLNQMVKVYKDDVLIVISSPKKTPFQLFLAIENAAKACDHDRVYIEKHDFSIFNPDSKNKD